jgi:hypothetical protein
MRYMCLNALSLSCVFLQIQIWAPCALAHALLTRCGEGWGLFMSSNRRSFCTPPGRAQPSPPRGRQSSGHGPGSYKHGNLKMCLHEILWMHMDLHDS